MAAITIVGTNPQYFEGGEIGGKLIGGGNMPAMHLAHAVGGNLLLGFLSAVAFATILAVVSGLALAGASAISPRPLRQRHHARARRPRLRKCASPSVSSLVLGVLAVLLGIAVREAERRVLVGLAFGVAASCNFPVLILSMYWKGLTTRGAIWGSIAGLVSAVLIVVLSKAVWVIGARQQGADLPVRAAGDLLHAAGVLLWRGWVQ